MDYAGGKVELNNNTVSLISILLSNLLFREGKYIVYENMESEKIKC